MPAAFRSATIFSTTLSPSPSPQSTRMRPNRPVANSCTCRTMTWSPLSRLRSRVISAAATTCRTGSCVATSTASRMFLLIDPPNRCLDAGLPNDQYRSVAEVNDLVRGTAQQQPGDVAAAARAQHDDAGADLPGVVDDLAGGVPENSVPDLAVRLYPCL